MPQKHISSNSDVSIESQFNVSPNPISTNSKLMIQLSEDCENVSIDIKDLYGRNIKNIATLPYLKIGHYSYALNSKDLPNGIMFVVISANNQLLTTIKITKQ